MSTVTVLGTGLLGAGFAQNLLRHGHAVSVWNRTFAKAEALAEHGARPCATAAEAVSGAERVHLVLTADDAVDEVVSSVLQTLRAGAWVIDHSTNLPARVAERFARLRAQGVRYVHAPVFMGPQNAREGTGLMLLSAAVDEVEALTPLLSAMTGKLWHVGERPDLAAVYKLMGNGLLVSISAAMGDMLAVGAAQGLEPAQVLAMFDQWKPGAALPFFGQRVAARGELPASWELSMARKDVRLMLETAGGPEGLITLPAVAAAMDRALADGHAARDYSIFAWPRGRR